jgi:spore germination cell wall hydrolase CwlJ-like protein
MKRIIAVILLLLSFNSLALTEKACLAEAIYHEARGEPILGKIAVAQVIKNRIASPAYPDTICKVVFQPGQFTWTATYILPRADTDSKLLAQMFLDSKMVLINFDAIYFSTNKLTWPAVKVVKIGNHIFYKDKL